MQELSPAGVLAMCALTLQNTALTISMKLSFRAEAQPYSAPLVILCVECMKLFSCFLIIKLSGGLNALKKEVCRTRHSPELAIPSLLYIVQNNLLLTAARHLSQTVFIVASQGKIISSAVFSVLLLRKRFSRYQLLALGMLAAGIVLVQLQTSEESNSTHETMYVGVCAMLTANLTSGYAGVFLERLFKRNGEQSIWVRNVQLCIFSIPISVVSVLFHRRAPNALANPLFAGFDSIVLLVILLNAVGGLISAFVMRYASAVLKCFAVAFSICLCTFAETFYGHIPSARMVAGITLVSASIFAYTRC